jgi:type III secretion protein U
MSDDKTEEPTEKRLRDAREEGQVSKSTDLTDAVTMSTAIAVLSVTTGSLADAFRGLVDIAQAFVTGDHSLQNMEDALYKITWQALIAILPVLVAAMFAAVAALAPQVGLQISTKAITPDLNAVSPGSGIKKLFSSRTLIELAKMTVKAILIACVMWKTIMWLFPLIVGSVYQPLPELAKMLWSITLKLLAVSALVFVVIGAADIKLQHMLFMRKMRMSKDEVKREHKQREGDPRIKGERRRLARQFMSDAPQKRVGFATALIVNPTHYAVAIRYAPHEFPLPLVTAKGADEGAAQLRRFAQEAKVPIIGNPSVARALYKVDVDEPVPEELFEAVAAILRWVSSIGDRQRPGSADSVHRVSGL